MKTITLQDFLSSAYADAENKKGVSAYESTKSEKEKLAEKLDDIERAYNENPYRTYGGYKVMRAKTETYDAPTDEDIVSGATQAVEADKAERAAVLQSAAEKKNRAYEKSKQEIIQAADESAAKIKADASAAGQEAENQALKRGIARSSIIAEELNAIDKAAIEASGEVYKKAQSGIADAEMKISDLETELQDALDNLDVKTAVELNEQIKKLKAERDEKISKTEENNAKEREKEVKQLNSLRAKGIAVGENDSEEYVTRTYEKIRSLYAYYYSLGKDAAEEVKKDKEFIEKHVGESGYNYLKGYFK